MNTYGTIEGWLILNLRTRCRWVVSFTPRPLWPRWKSSVSLNRILGWTQSRSGPVGKREKYHDIAIIYLVFCFYLYATSFCLLLPSGLSHFFWPWVYLPRLLLRLVLPPVVFNTILEFLWSFLLSENNIHVLSVTIFHLHFVLILQSVPWTVYIWCLDHVSTPFFQCINADFTILFYIWIENLREKRKYFYGVCSRSVPRASSTRETQLAYGVPSSLSL